MARFTGRHAVRESGNFGDVARSLALTEDRGSVIGRAVLDMGVGARPSA